MRIQIKPKDVDAMDVTNISSIANESNTATFPKISPDFTIEDIRKLRDYNSERFANMTRQEIVDDINNGAREFLALIENVRQTKYADYCSGSYSDFSGL